MKMLLWRQFTVR